MFSIVFSERTSKQEKEPGMVAYPCNASTLEANAGE